jgi:hypothetical protein
MELNYSKRKNQAPVEISFNLETKLNYITKNNHIIIGGYTKQKI